MESEDIKELLSEVRHILKVPEGASLVRYVRKVMGQTTQENKPLCLNCESFKNSGEGQVIIDPLHGYINCAECHRLIREGI